MRVTVAVVTYHSSAVLPGLIESLAEGLAGVGQWRLVVADNASTDGSADLARTLAPDALVIDMGGNLGYAAGVNACAAADSGSDAVLVLNPDVRLAPGSVARLTACLTADERVGIAVPRLVEPDGSLALSLRRRPTVLRAAGEAVLGGTLARRVPALSEVVADPDAYRSPTTADWATGAAMLVGRRCLRAVGPWDESFFLYSEETDFALRAADAGFRLELVPQAHAVHVGGQVHSSPELWTLLATNRVRLFARRHGRIRGTAFWAAVTAGESVRAVRRRGATHRAAVRALLTRRAELVGAR